MKASFFNIFVLFFLLSCSSNQKKVKTEMSYPITAKKEVTDTYFGIDVKDSYRWLEDDRSKETESWVKTENETTFAYLNEISFRSDLKKRLEYLWNYEKISAPFREGDFTYFYKNNGLQNQYVIYRQKENETIEVFLDPNQFSDDGTTSLGALSFSESGNIVAYSISEGGSDWRKIIVMDVSSKEIMEDTIKDVKFSGLSWKKNEGFFYSSYDKPKGSELSAKTDQHKLYYHKLGTSQSDDQLVFGGTSEEKHRYVGGNVTEDGKYLFVSASVSTSGNKLFMKDLTKPNSVFVTILEHTDSDTYVMENEGSKLYLATNLNAPNKKIVTVDASNPTPKNWVDFIQETEHVLSPSNGGGYFFAEYMVDAVSKVKQYNYDGEIIFDVELPGIGSVGGFGGKKEDSILYYSFSNYKTPSTIYSYKPRNGNSKIYKKPDVDFKPENYVSN
jgi:prolyl oligopeptidase